MIRIIKLLIRDIAILVETIICSLPTCNIFNYLRKMYFEIFFKIKNIHLIHSGIKIPCKTNISLGKNLVISDNVEINSCDSSGIYIGNDVVFGPGTYLRSANHDYKKPETPLLHKKHTFHNISYQNKKYSIVIEDNVWIGAKSIILSGAHIKKFSVVSAGSVVKKGDFPERAILEGNPAKLKKIIEK